MRLGIESRQRVCERHSACGTRLLGEAQLRGGGFRGTGFTSSDWL
jgi:hypothetical protein